MQRVPTSGYYENVVEDHNYTMFSMYPTINSNNPSDCMQLTKEEKAMKKRRFLDLLDPSINRGQPNG
ncbi:hypothetical protein HZH66_013283 [Vespula vulgaris]|uniref:Uncharacterized protein n=1 Tax=Vespula vulgaris TaxID=7454 RepID=A0A834J6L8_VESVU|nr:hypothetical protein HZH66_013283 [Vespula vulgaris]